ncbi:glutathione peroxidase [Paracoccus sp. (in: a-proteobacteria)]|uniref:glutathione peroxidase n=1 Tax=Paracoccus sp. TaxID=267 RepID=UPI0026E07141|nr:glutathione peroxidase [Paracoccus sp. (in: a-proteobacteria)]MDO5648901.1 glutathione peroxidase [Paracoccus sp. (in: a-proteobacteria)]
MKRRVFIACAAALAASPAMAQDAPSFRFPSIDGGTLNTADWRGRPVLVVNTASLCGFTPQLEGMQALYDELSPRGLVVLATPSNDFNQELDDAKKVREFCTLQFGITLPMSDIIHVRGDNAHPFWAWVRDSHGFSPNWNFNKVLIGPDGQIVDTWRSITGPGSRAIRRQIDPLL